MIIYVPNRHFTAGGWFSPRSRAAGWFNGRLAEIDAGDTTRRAQVSWAELEVPNAPRRAVVGWAEFEVPNVPAPRRAQIGWAELEVPNGPRRAVITWAELEVPTAPRRAVVTWAEFEVPEQAEEVSRGGFDEPPFLRAYPRKKDKKKRPLREELRAAVCALAKVPEAQPVLRQALESHVSRPIKADEPLPPIDFAGLARDLTAAKQLIAAYYKHVLNEEEDEDLLLLSLCPHMTIAVDCARK